MLKKILGGVGAVALILGAYLYHFAKTPMISGSTQKVEFDVLRGTRASEIARGLEAAGLIKNATAMVWLGKITRSWVGLKAADYELSPGMTPEQILKVLRSGIGVQKSLMIREGDNIYQVAAAFGAAGVADQASVLKILKSREQLLFLGLGQEGLRTFEGYLYPNTYFYDRGDSAIQIIKRVVDAFLRSWAPEFEARARELGMSRMQVVTLASVIEKETGASFERPIISSVFHNRLRKKMRLQSDPTVIYGIWERYTGNIRRVDLQTRTEYNTYTIPGLPIGPIANPHPDSIRAALYPSDTEFLYFVSRNDGTHAFSKSYQEHSEWVKKLQLDPKAKEGKSWRDLKARATPAPDAAR